MRDEARTIKIEMPPLPYFLGAGLASYRRGDEHPSRKNLGVFDWLCVAKGELHIGEEARQWSLSAGEALLLLPDREHYSVKPCEEETEFYWFHFSIHGRWEEAEGEPNASARPLGQPMSNPYVALLPACAKLHRPEAAFRLLKQLLAETAENRQDSFWKEQLFLLRWLDLMQEGRKTRTATSATRLAERAEAYLRGRYREDITNAMLAEDLHFHPNYVVRCVKEAYGVTPMEYLQEYRLEQAKRLLLTTEWPVAKVAESVGFRHAPYFSACFKRRTGVSPLRYRKQYSG